LVVRRVFEDGFELSQAPVGHRPGGSRRAPQGERAPWRLIAIDIARLGACPPTEAIRFLKKR